MKEPLKITGEIIQSYIGHTYIELFPTQHRLCIPIINRIYQKMTSGLRFDDIKVHDDLIIDGHHRYLSSLLSKTDIERIQMDKTSATKRHEWGNVEFVYDEWDTPEKIEKLNNDDAEFNNISLEVIIEMTK